MVKEYKIVQLVVMSERLIALRNDGTVFRMTGSVFKNDVYWEEIDTDQINYVVCAEETKGDE